MNLRTTTLLFTSIGWLFLSQAGLGGNPLDLPLEQQVQEVATLLEGDMDTSAQAAINPNAPSVRITTCRVTLNEATLTTTSNTILLYQEQALLNNLSNPYRQRFLQLSAMPLTQSVRSLSFRPVNPTTWIGLCNKPLGDRRVIPSELGIPICSVFLKRSGDSYIGNTPVDGCPTNMRGATRITNRILLRRVGMDTWDRGFDATGNQVWGAQGESYQFRRGKE
jgi:hypothetical protein